MASNNDPSTKKLRMMKGSSENQGEDALSEDSPGKAPLGLWWAAGVAVLVFALLLVGSYWALIGCFGLSAEDLFVRSGGGIATAIAAAVAAFLLYYRWTIEHPTQVKQEQKRLDAQDRLERKRLDAQARLHRQQQRGARQESLGERMAKAIDHLGKGNSYIQVAGFFELATLVDDWWSLGEEMLADLPGDGREQDRHRIEGLVQRRRQELIDLIFKNTPTPEQSIAEDGTEATGERAKMLRTARSQILRSHLAIVSDPAEVPDDPDSWRNLNFDGALLQGAHLQDMYLKGIRLSGAYLEQASLEGAHLEEARLDRAHLEGAILYRAYLEKANLNGAHLQEAYLIQAHLEDAILDDAHLEGAHLTQTHLEGAHLNGAHLEGAHLEGARLNGAHLKWAHLNGAHLTRTHLKGADLAGAHLEGADLRTRHLDAHYEGFPFFDEKTKWPPACDPAKSGFMRFVEDYS